MRVSLLASLALVLPLAMPVAGAVPTSLSMELAEGPFGPRDVVPVTITLRAREFTCFEDHEFVVGLQAYGTDGVKAVFEVSRVVFPVPARTYYVDEFVANATVNLTLRALREGDVELVASFAAEEGRCFAPDGFQPQVVNVTRHVSGPYSEPAPEPTPEPTPATPTPSPTPPTTAATPPTPTSQPRPTTCAPGTTCGPIGEFEGPQESAGGNDTPGVAVGALVAAFVVVALLARRR